ncbi:hypothetical protein SPI_02313 [Niveomyces insectorum RCEF 264]|uniref:Clr5 domain-containing protein n=1 Tax=Niveomyces insectorum RCEF 264 TaxID=1081102 RepID=A0A167XX67_9HYPO|nr:hypothetical protein SPI_02313 [Niveomyces insectorum RCEF 264]
MYGAYYQTPTFVARPMFRPEKAEDWEPYREIIATLYAEHTLAFVMKEMQDVHFFSATQKQYKTKFKEWGLDTKYIKDFEYEELLNQGEQEEYNVRGKRVPYQDVARYQRRKEKSEGKGSGKGKSSSKRKDETGGGSGASSSAYGSSSSYNAGDGSSGGYAFPADQYVDYAGDAGAGGYAGAYAYEQADSGAAYTVAHDVVGYDAQQDAELMAAYQGQPSSGYGGSADASGQGDWTY